MTVLSYDIDHPTLRSPAEEWQQPHAAQTPKSTEWWYLTSLAFDVRATRTSSPGACGTSAARTRITARYRSRTATA